MTTTVELADFVLDVSYEGLSEDIRDEIKKRILDSLGIAIGAMGEEPVEQVRSTVEEVDADGACNLWGGGSASPNQAAMYNTALTRYLDFMDSFLAPGETPHPSDNIASVMACAEHAGSDGKEVIEAVGVAYEVQRELAYNAPVRDRGFDHVTHTVISAAAGSGKVLGLDMEQLRNAIGIAGTAHNALRVTRTEGINEWKGMASANAARNAVYSCLLSGNGMEGPVNLFEGEKGWKHIISGDFEADLDTDCPSLHDVMTKKYVAETYAQSAVEGILEFGDGSSVDPRDIDSIEIKTFHGAYQLIGGGAGGDRHEVETKAKADHSLPYMLAAALIDGEMTNSQYRTERIKREDVQQLLQKVSVIDDGELTERFENGNMPAVIDITLEDGTETRVEKDAFEGHPSQPASWDMIEEKFHGMASERYGEGRREEIVEAVRNLEEASAEQLTALLD